MAHILVIEDDSMLRSMLHQMLEHEGHDVLVAEDGLEATRLYQKQTNIDLIVTDVLMPEKDGLEVIMDIRNQMPHVKIIAISGGGRISHTDYLIAARRLGAHKTLPKPFARQELMDSINSLLAPPTD
jgi:CheY-like chemotaxis protein